LIYKFGKTLFVWKVNMRGGVNDCEWSGPLQQDKQTKHSLGALSWPGAQRQWLV